jgi:signal transduction histidine kinase
MSLRVRSVRTKILLLTLVPMLSLFGLYVFATSITAQDALNLARASSIKSATGEPVGAFLAQLDVERPLAMVYLSAPSAGNLTKLRMQGQKTDQVARMMRAALLSPNTQNNASPTEKQAIAVVLKEVATLPGLRTQVLSRVVGKPLAFDSYNNVVTDAYQVLNQAIHEETSSNIVTQGLAFVRMGRSEDMLLREDALLLGDLAARSFPPADREQFAQLAGARRTLFSLTLGDLDPAYRVYYTRDINPQALAALTSFEDTVMGDARPGPPPINPADWQRAVGGVSAGLTAAGNQSADALTKQASSVAATTNLRLLLAGGAGLLAVIISILVAILTSRSLVRELTALRRSALELANDRLPQVVANLADGKAIEMPGKEMEIPAKSDEIGQVRDAFAKVQRTAVEAAVGQARLREGISDVFRNLARRSQSLLHRQLTLLDTMERRAADPEQLADLFRIDHLTTRMRRHAESLIILSGQAPARGWRNPVPLVDVLRAAVAEVEDYTRVRVIATTRAALAGPAVGDVIHMLAELAENATVFSPPNTPVLITGDVVGRGFAVEIEDRGLGLGEDKIAEINERLANPPPFDPSGTDQLGLFVAGQLAKRHDIRIRLRESPYGGTTAIVLIPHVLVIPDGAQGPLPAAGRAMSTGRHASREEPRPISNGHEPPGWMAGRTLGGRGAGPEALNAPPAPPEAPAREAPTWDSHAWEAPAAGAPSDDTGPVPAVEVPQPDVPAAGDAGLLGLPRRVRQASLAPQLRTGSARFTPPASAELLAGNIPLSAPAGAEHHETRTPDETRATLSAIQRGWQRGRSVFEPSGGEPGAAGDPAPPGGPAMDAGGTTAPSAYPQAGALPDTGYPGRGASGESGGYEDTGGYEDGSGYTGGVPFGGRGVFGRGTAGDQSAPGDRGSFADDGAPMGTDGSGHVAAAAEDNGLAGAEGFGQADDPAAMVPGGNGFSDAPGQPANADRLLLPGTDTGFDEAAEGGDLADSLAASGHDAGVTATAEVPARDGENGSEGEGSSEWS